YFLIITPPGRREYITNHCDNIANNINIANLRNQFRADIVVVFTNQNYVAGDRRIFGAVNNIGLNPASAFTIVEAPFISALGSPWRTK
ncbi:MAG TPA: hypothetical protein PK198_08465, partial [Saprospiraceae bacterium]|nr:hypothetical protein [Saprospiraceae bacterium]HRK82345.1 hypothetical protein [Saprospiraceae bacterium]